MGGGLEQGHWDLRLPNRPCVCPELLTRKSAIELPAADSLFTGGVIGHFNYLCVWGKGHFLTIPQPAHKWGVNFF